VCSRADCSQKVSWIDVGRRLILRPGLLVEGTGLPLRLVVRRDGGDRVVVQLWDVDYNGQTLVEAFGEFGGGATYSIDRCRFRTCLRERD
jgi:hypothetical protein